MQRLYEHGKEDMEPDLISILINLAANKKNAQVMCEGVSSLDEQILPEKSGRVK